MTNRLAAETSPYLRQHADNPVDWHPWNEAALTLAREADRPILLSIGYSACHWCHVMAHESFEDAATAAVMNRLFVNIKVDREERPDLDQIYQLAHQMLTGRSGGWPLTMFLTPQGVPFYAGTYFPQRPRYRLPGFIDLLERIDDAYRGRRSEVEAQGRALVDALAQSFDARYGGFGGAPKFPRPSELALLLRLHHRQRDPQLLAMVTTTLRHMADGGVNDQIGGGFYRYSVDAEWGIPHFEKMLYDNAQLLAVCVDAWRVTRDPLLADVVEATIGWIGREMCGARGEFFSSLDADSEGEEGRFYVWDRRELQEVVGERDWPLAARHFGLDREPNFEHRAWHLRVAEPATALAATAGDADGALAPRLADIRARLLAARGQRVRPACDDKCLTAWNALTIGALARAARAFDRPEWLAMARRALDFIREEHWHDGRLLATSRGGHAHLNAYLDDYAFLLDALVELLQADWRSADLAFARQLAGCLQANFIDEASGCFLFTSHDHETLILRPCTAFDNALPAGSAVAVLALLRLARLTGLVSYEDTARRALRAHLAQIADAAGGASTLLIALDEALIGGRLVVIDADAAKRAGGHGLGALYAPDALVLVVDATALGELPLAATAAPGALATACEPGRCLPPFADLAALAAYLGAPPSA